MKDKINSLIISIEDSKLSIIYFFISFLFVLFLRNFFEIYSDQNCISLRCFAHYNFGFFWLATLLMLVFHLVLKVPMARISRLIFGLFVIIWVAPLADLIISSGQEKMSYLEPGRHKDLWKHFVTFWGVDDYATGATMGIRIEVALVLLGCFYYSKVFLKKSLVRTLFFIFLVYSSIFLYGMFPFLGVGFLESFNIYYQGISPDLHSDFYLFLIFFNCCFLFYFFNKKYFFEIFKDLRFLRLFYYQLIFILGLVFAFDQMQVQQWRLSQTLFFDVFGVAASLFFSILFSILVNNFYDLEIDIVSNSQRPSVKGEIPKSTLRALSIFCLIFSIIYSSHVNFESFFYILIFTGIYYLYSAPPLRLKRIPFFSKFLVAINSFVLFALGYFTVSRSVYIPLDLGLFIIMALSLCLHFIDIKDYEGDLKAGVKTLPTLVGLKKSKIYIGLFFVFSYCLAYFPLKKVFNYPKEVIMGLLFLGCLQFYFINRKKYSETPIFMTFFSGLVIVYLFKELI
ncbi:MAG: UbiA family prenyltransferase [Bdellovibrionales bacterium]|nr:UbiA family prenyltransferase [Bdellovibrionales bacterium]